ncbi:MAG: TlpA disulfide reductase family protein [Bacteroidales bacterium]|nr:TlpA disulfide reductase family protein [Bacteroidales bacterium]
MTKNYFRLFALIVVGLAFTSFTNESVTCVIKGKIVGRNSETMMLLKATDDYRFCQNFIPIRGNTFEYTLTIPRSEMYVLIFQDEFENGSMRPIYFFPEEGILDLTLYPMEEYKKNLIEGGPLTNEYYTYQKEITETLSAKSKLIQDSLSSLNNRNEYLGDSAKIIMDALKDANGEKRNALYKKLEDLRFSGAYYSDKARPFILKLDSFNREYVLWRKQYIKQHHTMVTYYLLLDDLRTIDQGQNIKQKERTEIDDIKENFAVFSKTFPDHPYTPLIKKMIESYENIHVGGRFIDFSAPDLEGTTRTLSAMIEGKITLIDLWASWCSPCIVTARTMIPVYKDFKDKGFTIVGVASERDNTDRMKAIIEKEKYPWINLVDLNQKNQIWYKYGISNSGGGTFLVDKDGKILAVNPTAEEVRTILQKISKHDGVLEF